MRYDNFDMIEDSSRLADFLNSIMRRLQKIRTICSPVSFIRDKDISDFQDTKFCDFCRYETWMHAVVAKLRMWESAISEYFAEFDGSWKYYAMSKKRELGEDTDAEDYKYYSIVSCLYTDGYRDIVQDTTPSNLKELCSDLIANSRIDILDGIKKHFGDSVQPFKMDDGVLRPLSQEEHELDMALEQANAEDDATRILGVAGSIKGILMIIKSCKLEDDNTELLQMAHTMTCALLDMDFGVLHANIRKFNDKYGGGE